MMPDAELFGYNHVFIRIATNDRDAMVYLHTEAGIKKVVQQAFLGLGIKEGSFDPFKDLMWARWPRGEKVREPKADFPCIGEHYWPHKELYELYSANTASDEEFEQALARAREEQEKRPSVEEPKGKLPQVPPEIVFILAQRYYGKNKSNSEQQ